MGNTQSAERGTVIKSVTVHYPSGEEKTFSGERVVRVEASAVGLVLTVKHEVDPSGSVDIVGLPMTIERGAAMVELATGLIKMV